MSVQKSARRDPLLDVWIRAAREHLGAGAHAAEVAALLLERIERLRSRKTREALLRSALVRAVRALERTPRKPEASS